MNNKLSKLIDGIVSVITIVLLGCAGYYRSLTFATLAMLLIGVYLTLVYIFTEREK